MPSGITLGFRLILAGLVVLVVLAVAGVQSRAAPAQHGHGPHAVLPDATVVDRHPCPDSGTCTLADCSVLHCAAPVANVPQSEPATMQRVAGDAGFVRLPSRRLEGWLAMPDLPPPRRLG
ncbi:MAG: hypothetical protein U1E70_03485 [Acetobacteraceae bacterium]